MSGVKRTSRFLGMAAVGVACSLCGTTADAQDVAPATPDWVRGPYLNVVLSIENVPEMRAFYGGLLELEALPDLTLPAREGRPVEVLMVRYKVGPSQIKMIHHPDLSRVAGGKDTANGLRVISIPVTIGGRIARRHIANTGIKIQWERGYRSRVGWLLDPDGNEVELRWYGESIDEALRTRLELGLTVADVEATRQHYGEWLGLPELDPLELPGFAGTTHRFGVGASMIRVWSSGQDLKQDSGFTLDGYGHRYVQFVVNDADALHADLVAAGAGIAQEPTALGTSTVLLFAQDPDGVINECVGPGRKAK